MFDTPESEPLKPAPHLWPAFLYPHESRRGYFAPPTGVSDAHIVFVRANHGRWITNCLWCNSAQEASRNDRLFYCAKCQNEPIGNATVRVEWPDEPDAIEALLLERPFRENRNWEPHESVADLGRENTERL